jgi:hypothetical protein
VTDPEALKQRYLRLLAWYPGWFRAQHQDEMLGVLMAGAWPGQRRPSLAEAANVIGSALGMRLRSFRTGPRNPAGPTH